MRPLTISEAQLASVARLRDDPAVLPTLRRARLSRNLAFLAESVQGSGGGAAFEVLAELQDSAQLVVRRMLEHPRFGAWTTGGAPELLAAFAAAAAVEAEAAFELEVPLIDGTLVLPSLGSLSSAGDQTVSLRSPGGANPLAALPGWRPLRSLTAEVDGTTIAVEFDDLPVAGSGLPAGFPEPSEVDAVEFELWRARTAGAFRLLTRTVPELGLPLIRGLRSIIPLPHNGPGVTSATATDAFGAASMSLPPDAAAMATILLHEFQHTKLSVLSEIAPLVADDEADLYSPWRTEARPASAVLHGAFAHLAVARLWSRLAGRAPAGRAWAEAELARTQTLAACEDLLNSGRLTKTGRRFVRGLHGTARDLAPAPAASTRRLAAARLEAHRSRWAGRRRDLAAPTPEAPTAPSRTEARS